MPTTALPSGGEYNEYTTILAIVIIVVFAGLMWLMHSQGKREDRRTDKIADGLDNLGTRFERGLDKVEKALQRQDDKADDRHSELTRYLNGRTTNGARKEPHT